MDVRIFANPKARKSTDHQSTRSEGYEETRSDSNSYRGTKEFGETRSGDIDFRIQGPPYSTVQKEDYHRTENGQETDPPN